MLPPFWVSHRHTSQAVSNGTYQDAVPHTNRYYITKYVVNAILIVDVMNEASNSLPLTPKGPPPTRPASAHVSSGETNGSDNRVPASRFRAAELTARSLAGR